MSLLKTIKMMASASLWLITPFLPIWSRSLSKWLRMGPFPQSPPPHLRFQVSGPDLYQAVKRSWQLGTTSSPHPGRLHCLLQSSLRTYILSSGCPKNGPMGRRNKCLWSTASKVKLCGMWVELYKNTMSHLILLIVAIRRARTTAESQMEEVANSRLPTEMRGSGALPWVFEASCCFAIHLKLFL